MTCEIRASTEGLIRYLYLEGDSVTVRSGRWPHLRFSQSHDLLGAGD